MINIVSATSTFGKFVFALLVSLLVGLSGFASMASASTQYPSVTRGTTAYLDWCPGNASICLDNKAIAKFGAGVYLKMNCWIDARSTGYNTVRWFYSTMSNGQTGFLNASGVGSQEVVGACSGKLDVMASLWTTGLEHYAAIYPTATDKSQMLQYFGFNNWGPKADWSGDCISFASLAWLSTGTTHKIQYGNAIDSYNKYKALGKIKAGTPPRGALVYWNVTSFGHVAISLGNGMTMGTVGMDNDLAPTALKPTSAYANYLGWAMPF